jgi:hypothetical protein
MKDKHVAQAFGQALDRALNDCPIFSFDQDIARRGRPFGPAQFAEPSDQSLSIAFRPVPIAAQPARNPGQPGSVFRWQRQQPEFLETGQENILSHIMRGLEVPDAAVRNSAHQVLVPFHEESESVSVAAPGCRDKGLI